MFRKVSNAFVDENVVSDWSEFNQLVIRMDDYNVDFNYGEITKNIYQNIEIIVDRVSIEYDNYYM